MMKMLLILSIGMLLTVCVGQEDKHADDPKASNLERALEDQILHFGLGFELSLDIHEVP